MRKFFEFSKVFSFFWSKNDVWESAYCFFHINILTSMSYKDTYPFFSIMNFAVLIFFLSIMNFVVLTYSVVIKSSIVVVLEVSMEKVFSQ